MASLPWMGSMPEVGCVVVEACDESGTFQVAAPPEVPFSEAYRLFENLCTSLVSGARRDDPEAPPLHYEVRSVWKEKGGPTKIVAVFYEEDSEPIQSV